MGLAVYATCQGGEAFTRWRFRTLSPPPFWTRPGVGDDPPDAGGRTTRKKYRWKRMNHPQPKRRVAERRRRRSGGYPGQKRPATPATYSPSGFRAGPWPATVAYMDHIYSTNPDMQAQRLERAVVAVNVVSDEDHGCAARKHTEYERAGFLRFGG